MLRSAKFLCVASNLRSPRLFCKVHNSSSTKFATTGSVVDQITPVHHRIARSIEENISTVQVSASESPRESISCLEKLEADPVFGQKVIFRTMLVFGWVASLTNKIAGFGATPIFFFFVNFEVFLPRAPSCYQGMNHINFHKAMCVSLINSKILNILTNFSLIKFRYSIACRPRAISRGPWDPLKMQN